jgi:hypothetical protein
MQAPPPLPSNTRRKGLYGMIIVARPIIWKQSALRYFVSTRFIPVIVLLEKLGELDDSVNGWLEEAQKLELSIEIAALTSFSIATTVVAARALNFLAVDGNSRSSLVVNIADFLWHFTRQHVGIQRQHLELVELCKL